MSHELSTNTVTRRLLVIAILVLFLNVGLARTTLAAMRKTLTPRISIEEQYDDNIDLEPEDEDSDWITLVSPGIGLALEGTGTTMNLDYEAGFSFYRDDSSRDSIRHRGQAGWDQDLSQHLRFHLSDTFLRSEDPIVWTEGVIEDIDLERRIYYRNTGEASLSYDFGAEDQITAGYRNRYLHDTSVWDQDSVGHEGFLNLDTWFTPQFGIGMTSRYTRGHFKQWDDFDQYGAGLTVNYRWQRLRRVYARYDFLYHDFEEPDADDETNDFRVHQGALGVSLALGSNTDLNLEGGHFLQDYLNGNQAEGPIFSGSLSTRMKRTSLHLEGSAGWNQDYYSSENLGSYEYRQVLGTADYLLTESLRIFGSASYYWEHFLETAYDRTDEVWHAAGGLSFSFWRWLTLALEGSHMQRDSDESTMEFEDNRVMLRLTGAYPYVF